MRNLFLILALLLAPMIAAAQGGTPPGGYGPGGSGGSLGSSPGTFNFLSYSGIDDNSTDNCATGAVAAFNVAVAAYSGPGTAAIDIKPGSSNKAYKLATSALTCHFEFDKPVNLNFTGALNCAQAATAENCIQLGAKGLGAQANVPTYFITGGGFLTGGAGLVNGGIEIEPWVTNTIIDGLQFLNFGAGNATLGNSTNFAIIFDTPVFEGTVTHTQWASTDGTIGRSGYSNAQGASTGQNTVLFTGNTMGGGPGNGGACGSVAITEGGSFGVVDNNNIFAFGVDVRLQGKGTRVRANPLDSAGCQNHGTGAPIQWGAGGGATTALTDISIDGNNCGGSAGGNLNFFAKAGDTGGPSSITNVALYGNNGNCINLTDGSSCIPGVARGIPCYITSNSTMTLPNPGGSTSTGWSVDGVVGILNTAAQTAPLGSTLIIAPPITASYSLEIGVVETTAATTSSTLPTAVTISYTEAFSSAPDTKTLTLAGCTTTANVVGTSCVGTIPLASSNANVTITSITGYASTGATAMAYKAWARMVLTR